MGNRKKAGCDNVCVLATRTIRRLIHPSNIGDTASKLQAPQSMFSVLVFYSTLILAFALTPRPGYGGGLLEIPTGSCFLHSLQYQKGAARCLT